MGQFGIGQPVRAPSRTKPPPQRPTAAFQKRFHPCPARLYALLCCASAARHTPAITRDGSELGAGPGRGFWWRFISRRRPRRPGRDGHDGGARCGASGRTGSPMFLAGPSRPGAAAGALCPASRSPSSVAESLAQAKDAARADRHLLRHPAIRSPTPVRTRLRAQATAGLGGVPGHNIFEFCCEERQQGGGPERPRSAEGAGRTSSSGRYVISRVYAHFMEPRRPRIGVWDPGEGPLQRSNADVQIPAPGVRQGHWRTRHPSFKDPGEPASRVISRPGWSAAGFGHQGAGKYPEQPARAVRREAVAPGRSKWAMRAQRGDPGRRAMARDNISEGELALDANGKFLGLRWVRTFANVGAYISVGSAIFARDFRQCRHP